MYEEYNQCITILVIVCYNIRLQFTISFTLTHKETVFTVYAANIYKELIDNFNKNGSNIYSCLLDASKAFNKIHYGILFNVLLKKCVPFCMICILIDAYTRQ